MKAIYLICGGRRPGRFVRGMRAFCALSAVAAVSSLQAAEFFVSPDGDDSAPGTFMKPFATIVRARDAVRDSRTPRSRATVYLRGGEYNVRKPLVLSFADSGTAGAPVTYRAWKDETPVLTGGFAIPPAAWQTGQQPAKKFFFVYYKQKSFRAQTRASGRAAQIFLPKIHADVI